MALAFLLPGDHGRYAVRAMMKADRIADEILGAGALGGAAGVLVQHFFFPRADGAFLAVRISTARRFFSRAWQVRERGAAWVVVRPSAAS